MFRWFRWFRWGGGGGGGGGDRKDMFRMSCFAGTLGGFVAPLCCTSAGYMPMYAASLVKHGSVYVYVCIYIYSEYRQTKP